jgi:tRNA threonylcarbamoyladenosine biosynthesis protein TsaE
MLYSFTLMSEQMTIHDGGEIRDAARKILRNYSGKKVFTFGGELGTGKTTLIKAICEVLGVTEKATSPTFAIVNEYTGVNHIFHLDLYRLRSLNEAIEIGIDEYLYSNNYCFIEWPELIIDLLPDETVMIKIFVGLQGERILNITKKGEQSDS